MATRISCNTLPEDDLVELQDKLSELRDSSPAVPFDDMRKVIERELGDRISNLFAEFDPDAVAAASIGQVYRARLKDGREVAVKVQYPGIAEAGRAERPNRGLLIRARRRVVQGLDC